MLRVKVGKLYVSSIDVDSDYINTEFIEELDLTADIGNAMEISEEQEQLYMDKIVQVLNLNSANPYDIITFEKV